MHQDRRTFLKTAGLAGAAVVAGTAVAAPAAAQRMATPRTTGPQQMPTGMAFATLWAAPGTASA